MEKSELFQLSSKALAMDFHLQPKNPQAVQQLSVLASKMKDGVVKQGVVALMTLYVNPMTESGTVLRAKVVRALQYLDIQ